MYSYSGNLPSYNTYVYDSTVYTVTFRVTEDDDGLHTAALMANDKGEAVKALVFTNRYTAGRLPQTGLLWWPVPVLFSAGLLLVAAAFALSGYNLWTEQKTAAASDAVIRELAKLIVEAAPQSRTQEKGQWVFLPTDDAESPETTGAREGQWVLIAELSSEEIANADSGRQAFIPDADTYRTLPLAQQAGEWRFIPESLLRQTQQEATGETAEGKWVYLCALGVFGTEHGDWVFLSDAAIAAADRMSGSSRWVFLANANERGELLSETTGRWIMLPVHAVQDAEASELSLMLPAEQAQNVPDYIVNPEMNMPEMLIDGRRYIGILQIPALELELPVMSEWSYTGLRIAPCRYAGSAYQDNLVICAHNYSKHFGNLGALKSGTEIRFTDADGNLFRYSVVEMETLKPRAIEQMVDGDWDLTLFTCTIGGSTRITVRCDRLLE